MKKRDDHAIHCAVCKSQKRKALEDDYLDGQPVSECATMYEFEEHTVYRHVKATGLRAKLLNDTLGTVQRLIERGADDIARRLQNVDARTTTQLLRLQAELRKEIESRDPLFIILQQVSPEVRDRLAESIRNRFASGVT